MRFEDFRRVRRIGPSADVIDARDIVATDAFVERLGAYQVLVGSAEILEVERDCQLRLTSTRREAFILVSNPPTAAAKVVLPSAGVEEVTAITRAG